MILIYNNRGILIPVFVIVPIIFTTIISKVLKENIEIVISSEATFQIAIGIGLLISFVWTYLTSYDYITVNGEKERIEMNHHFFYIPNRLWSYIMLGAGFLCIIGGILEFIFGK